MATEQFNAMVVCGFNIVPAHRLALEIVGERHVGPVHMCPYNSMNSFTVFPIGSHRGKDPYEDHLDRLIKLHKALEGYHRVLVNFGEDDANLYRA